MYSNNHVCSRLSTKLFFVLCLLNTQFLFAQLQVSVARTDAQYELGEWVNFSVTTNTAGTFHFRIAYHNSQTSLYEGTINATAGMSYDIPFHATEPGFLQCTVTQNNQSQVAVAAVSPFDIQPYETEPSDFDTFWESVKDELAQIPVDPTLDLVNSTVYSNTYRVKLAQLANRKVYGYISVPTGTGPFPAILNLPDFGDEAGQVQPIPSLAEEGNALSMTISIHNTKPTAKDPLAYFPNVLNNRDSIYYKFAIAAAIRSIDYLFSRTDFDGEQLGVMGTGQGAGLATCVAGIDTRVKVLISNNASLGQQNAYQFDRASAQPNYLQQIREASDYSPAKEIAVQQALKYYDPTYFAKRFTGASLSYLGYLNQDNPPATGFAIFNQLQGKKILAHGLTLTGPSPTYEEESLAFLKQHISGMINPAHPNGNNTTSFYEVYAGSDQLIFLPANTEVTGIASLNDTDLSNSAKFSWRLYNGPQAVVFSNPYQQATTLIFNHYGIYKLEFKARNLVFTGSGGILYDGIDYLNVAVSIF